MATNSATTTESGLNTPVAFFMYNRPETTARVFAAIARARPRQLLVVADGPRAHRPEEAERCAAARAIVEQVDWPCQVLKNYAPANLGCRRRLASGLDWVFETVEEAILLEDDCLPHPTFFRFCEELLARYRDDQRVMHIGGDNFQFGRHRINASYYFSRYPHIWGWATWRRAWRHYDADLKEWAASPNRAQYLRAIRSPAEKRFWTKAWEGICRGQIDTWDYQWAFACFAHHGRAIAPGINLVSNIGFGARSTHTVDHSFVADLSVEAMRFPLNHPETLILDEAADEHTRRLFFTRPTAAERAANQAGKLLWKALAHTRPAPTRKTPRKNDL